MEKEIMKIFVLETKIDDRLNEVRKIADNAYDYLYNPVSTIEREDVQRDLEEVEEIIKDAKRLLDLLEEEYEKNYIKNNDKEK